MWDWGVWRIRSVCEKGIDGRADLSGYAFYGMSSMALTEYHSDFYAGVTFFILFCQMCGPLPGSCNPS